LYLYKEVNFFWNFFTLFVGVAPECICILKSFKEENSNDGLQHSEYVSAGKNRCS